MKYVILIILTFTLAFSQKKKEQDELFYKAYKAYESGDFEKSLEFLNRLISRSPDYKGAHNLRGLNYLSMFELDSAVQSFTLAIASDTNNADAYNNRGLARMNMEQLDSAFIDFNKAIEKDPKFAEAYINRGTANFSVGFAEKAMADFNEAERYNNKNPEMYSQRAKLHAYIKEYDKEIKDIEKAIKTGMVNAEIYFRLGNAYYRQGKHELAIKQYDKSLSIDSTFYNSLNNRAMAYESSGKADLAARDRARLNALSGNMFLHPDSLRSVLYTAPDSLFSVEIPHNWIAKDTVMDDMVLTMLSLEDFHGAPDPLLPSIQLCYNKNMMKNYGVEDPASILEYWKERVKANSLEFYRYDVFTQKHMSRDGFACILNHSLFQYSKATPPLNSYELAMADTDMLFYAYLSAPLPQWDYFKPIFERILDNMKVKKFRGS